MKLLKEFKQFAIKGNVVDMGVGIVIGAAFTSIVNSLVKDLFTPLLALLTTGVNFSNWFITLRKGNSGGPYTTIIQAQQDSAITLNIGLFANSVISFLIVAIILFFIARMINRLKSLEKETTETAAKKECPYCFSVISNKAKRCPFCTTELNE